MAWRVIATEQGTWRIYPAAERRANARFWQLMLSFRRVGDPDGTRSSFWAPYPLESLSKQSLYSQADRIGDDELRDLLARFAD